MATLSSSRRKCKFDPNVFCYICSSFTVFKQRQGTTDFVKRAYLAYFGIKGPFPLRAWAGVFFLYLLIFYASLNT